ncbi:MAG TPA: hypothetical protein VK760_02655, partial [Candidatus Acidoferrales bacterium]|nr:hypothetical protein [Candidatus Acidoferrales bacterium]
GFSNGAAFSNYLACNQANRFAAVAPVSGPLPVVDAPNCRPQRALSFLEISGTTDPLVPFNGGEVVIAGMRRGEVLSFAQNGAFWAKNAGCAADPTSTPLPAIAPADGTSVTRTSFSKCRTGTAVVEYAVAGGGHAWPGGPQYLPKLLVGTASRQLDASETIVQFFLAHPMP